MPAGGEHAVEPEGATVSTRQETQEVVAPAAAVKELAGQGSHARDAENCPAGQVRVDVQERLSADANGASPEHGAHEVAPADGVPASASHGVHSAAVEGAEENEPASQAMQALLDAAK